MQCLFVELNYRKKRCYEFGLVHQVWNRALRRTDNILNLNVSPPTGSCSSLLVPSSSFLPAALGFVSELAECSDLKFERGFVSELLESSDKQVGKEIKKCSLKIQWLFR